MKESKNTSKENKDEEVNYIQNNKGADRDANQTRRKLSKFLENGKTENHVRL